MNRSKRCFQRAGLLVAGYVVLLSIGLAGKTSAAPGSDDNSIRIVISDDGAATKQIVAALKRRYPSSEVLAGSTAKKMKGRGAVDIAVGPAALQTLLENGSDGFIISIFTSSEVYRGILEKAPKVQTYKVTAVFADPSPMDQFQLISRLYKRRVRVGVLISETTHHLIPFILKAATSANVDVRVEHVDVSEGVARALNRTRNASVILAIPDSNIYNTGSIHSILDTTYRRSQAVIGFSPSMVRAGVLASTYSDVDDIVTHLAELIGELERTGVLPVPQYPKYFQVQINESVARSLNVVVDGPGRAFSRKPNAR